MESMHALVDNEIKKNVRPRDRSHISDGHGLLAFVL